MAIWWNFPNHFGNNSGVLKIIFYFVAQEVVAFTVVDKEDTTFQTDERIRYNIIQTNVGGGYMAQQHEFICPVSG